MIPILIENPFGANGGGATASTMGTENVTNWLPFGMLVVPNATNFDSIKIVKTWIWGSFKRNFQISIYVQNYIGTGGSWKTMGMLRI